MQQFVAKYKIMIIPDKIAGKAGQIGQNCHGEQQKGGENCASFQILHMCKYSIGIPAYATRAL
jgi:hypothetical protein